MRKAFYLGFVLLALIGCSTSLTEQSHPDVAAIAGADAAGARAGAEAVEGLTTGTVAAGVVVGAAAVAAAVITSGSSSNNNSTLQHTTTSHH